MKKRTDAEFRNVNGWWIANEEQKAEAIRLANEALVEYNMTAEPDAMVAVCDNWGDGNFTCYAVEDVNSGEWWFLCDGELFCPDDRDQAYSDLAELFE